MIWNENVALQSDVGHAADVLTDGGQSNIYIFVRAGGSESTMEISRRLAYLYFMKTYIYKKNQFALMYDEQRKSDDGSGTLLFDGLIISTCLSAFFQSSFIYSAWPKFWSNCKGLVISKRSWQEAFDCHPKAIFAMPDTLLERPSKRARISEEMPPNSRPAPTQLVSKKKSSKPIRLVPMDDRNLRRSTRATKYNGFKINQPTDHRVTKYKVAPRVIPSAAISAHDKLFDAKLKEKAVHQEKKMPPGPTEIKTIQHIGVHQCGIDAADLSTEKLHAKLDKDDKSSN